MVRFDTVGIMGGKYTGTVPGRKSIAHAIVARHVTALINLNPVASIAACGTAADDTATAGLNSFATIKIGCAVCDGAAKTHDDSTAVVLVGRAAGYD